MTQRLHEAGQSVPSAYNDYFYRLKADSNAARFFSFLGASSGDSNARFDPVVVKTVEEMGENIENLITRVPCIFKTCLLPSDMVMEDPRMRGRQLPIMEVKRYTLNPGDGPLMPNATYLADMELNLCEHRDVANSHTSKKDVRFQIVSPGLLKTSEKNAKELLDAGVEPASQATGISLEATEFAKLPPEQQKLKLREAEVSDFVRRSGIDMDQCHHREWEKFRIKPPSLKPRGWLF